MSQTLKRGEPRPSSEPAICVDCTVKPATHEAYDTKVKERVPLCCKCYIGRGYIPLPWHTDCMSEWNLKSKS